MVYCGMRGLVNCGICVKCLLRFVKVWYPHPSRSLHLQWSNCTTAPMPVKQPWKIWATNAQVSKQKLYNKRYNKTNHGNTMRSERYILVRYTTQTGSSMWILTWYGYRLANVPYLCIQTQWDTVVSKSLYKEHPPITYTADTVSSYQHITCE